MSGTNVLIRLKRLKNPYPVVDSVIYRGDKVLLVERREPVSGVWAIPGGFLEWGETFEDAAVREAREETGLRIRLEGLLGVYSDPKRDLRGHLVAVVFVARPVSGRLRISREHSDMRWFDVKDVGRIKMHADHRKILMDFAKWRKSSGTYWSTK